MTNKIAALIISITLGKIILSKIDRNKSEYDYEREKLINRL